MQLNFANLSPTYRWSPSNVIDPINLDPSCGRCWQHPLNTNIQVQGYLFASYALRLFIATEYEEESGWLGLVTGMAYRNVLCVTCGSQQEFSKPGS